MSSRKEDKKINNELGFDLEGIKMIEPFFVPYVEDEYVIVETMRYSKDNGRFKVIKQYLNNSIIDLSSGKKKIKFDELEIECQICGYKKSIKFVPYLHFRMLERIIGDALNQTKKSLG